MSYSKNPAVRLALAKTGGWASSPEFMGAVAAATVPFALTKAWEGGSKLVAAQQKSHAFKETIYANPHLKKFPARSSHRYFNTLYRVNPEMAKDPTVAGAFIQNQHELSDATFPNRGILAGAGEMAKMRHDIRKGSKPGPSFKDFGTIAQKGFAAHGAELTSEAEAKKDALNQGGASGNSRAQQLRQQRGRPSVKFSSLRAAIGL